MIFCGLMFIALRQSVIKCHIFGFREISIDFYKQIDQN